MGPDTPSQLIPAASQDKDRDSSAVRGGFRTRDTDHVEEQTNKKILSEIMEIVERNSESPRSKVTSHVDLGKKTGYEGGNLVGKAPDSVK